MRSGEWQPSSGPSMPLLGFSPLSCIVTGYMDEGYSLDELTVLARGNDPFRQDTAEGQKNAKWLRGTLKSPGVQIGEGGRKIHNRGLHCLLIGQRKRDGTKYANTENEWKWLNDRVSKAARVHPVRPVHRPAER